MLGFKFYESMTTAEAAVLMLLLFDLVFLTIIIKLRTSPLPPENKKSDDNKPPEQLCAHCKYYKNKDNSFMIWCSAYEPKPFIKLRKQRLCPLQGGKLNRSKVRKILSALKRDSDIFVLIAFIVIIILQMLYTYRQIIILQLISG